VIELLPEQHDLLRRMRNAVLATTGPAGSPHLAPVWYRWDGESFTVSTVRTSVKVADLRRDPRLAVCVDDQVCGDYLTAYGRGELIEDEERVAALSRPLLLKYLQPDEASARWPRINATGARVVIRVVPEQVSWRAGVH
jgi:PPOX class probable F420-dependent enzyme